MSSSYVINPPTPNINTNGTFNVLYTSDSIPLSDTANYDLVNTANNNTLKTISTVPYTANSFVSEYSTVSGRLPVVMYGLPNKSVLIDFNLTNPYNVVYSETGTKLLENRAGENSLSFGFTSDGSFVYGLTVGGNLNKYYLDGSYVQGATVNVGFWCYGCDYCPVDDLIYAVQNAGACEIYKVNKNGTKTLFVTLTECMDGYGLGGLAFNADYTYLYVVHRNTGNIYYIERANPSNRGILGTVSGQSGTVTYNKNLNTLYSCANSSQIIYAFKLITPTTCEPRQTVFTLGTGETTLVLHYSNFTDYLYIATQLFKVYVIKSNLLTFLSVPNQNLSSGTNTLQIKRNNVNFGDAISVTGVTDSSYSYDIVLDSYTVRPNMPKIKSTETFHLEYNSKSISMGDSANYNLVNTINNSTMKTVTGTSLSNNNFAITFPSTNLIYGLNNTNIIIANASTSSPYHFIYTEPGVKVSELTNIAVRETYGFTTDDVYIYGFTAGYIFNKFDLEGNFIETIANIGVWVYGVDYCVIDDFIYGMVINTNNIYKINKTTGTKTLFVTVSEITSGGGGDLVFNGDYTYMYTMEYNTGKIYYIERANPNNRGLLTTLGYAGRSLSCNRSTNVIYACNGTETKIYSIQLLTPTTCETKQTILNITANYYCSRVNYNNLTGYLYLITNDRSSNTCRVHTVKPTSITFSNIPTTYLVEGANTLQIKRGTVAFGDPMTVNATCFLEGTRILCLTEHHEERYIEIEKIRKGTLVKTHSHGFKPVHSIGKGKLFNPSKDTPTADRLYVLKKEKCTDLIDDLYITGHHSVLLRTITDKQRELIMNEMGKIYGTGERFRLPACLDERFEPYTDYGMKTIWHLALENDNIYKNYGVFANGLLVETCSIRYLTELSNLELQK